MFHFVYMRDKVYGIGLHCLFLPSRRRHMRIAPIFGFGYFSKGNTYHLAVLDAPYYHTLDDSEQQATSRQVYRKMKIYLQRDSGFTGQVVDLKEITKVSQLRRVDDLIWCLQYVYAFWRSGLWCGVSGRGYLRKILPVLRIPCMPAFM